VIYAVACRRHVYVSSIAAVYNLGYNQSRDALMTMISAVIQDFRTGFVSGRMASAEREPITHTVSIVRW